MTGLECGWAGRRGCLHGGSRESRDAPAPTLLSQDSSLCSVASVSSSLFRMMVWVGVRPGVRVAGVPAFLPSGLCSRWMWNLRCPFRLKLWGREESSGAAPSRMPSGPRPPVLSLTAARRGGMQKASHWCGSACVAAGPSCSWRQSCTGCTGGVAGSSAVPCGPGAGAESGPVTGEDRQLPTETTAGEVALRWRNWVTSTNQTEMWCCCERGQSHRRRHRVTSEVLLLL